MICEICGNEGAKVRNVTRSYGKGKDAFLIKDVPVVGCLNCGESYLTAETLHEVERLKLHHKSLAVETPIEVVQYA